MNKINFLASSAFANFLVILSGTMMVAKVMIMVAMMMTTMMPIV